MNNWFQEGVPTSYKIQVLYQEVPEFVKTRLVDTPFRFASYEDAKNVGDDMFKGVEFKIVGSSDKPHWQDSPMERVPSTKLANKSWYDLYGVAPVADYDVIQAKNMQTQRIQVAQAAEDINFQNLKKLKSFKTLPSQVKQKGQSVQVKESQKGQKVQKVQSLQVKESQKGQNGQSGQVKQKTQGSQKTQ